MTENISRAILEDLVHDLANPLTVALMETHRTMAKIHKGPLQNQNEMVLDSLERIQTKLSNMENILLQMKKYKQSPDFSEIFNFPAGTEAGTKEKEKEKAKENKENREIPEKAKAKPKVRPRVKAKSPEKRKGLPPKKKANKRAKK